MIFNNKKISLLILFNSLTNVQLTRPLIYCTICFSRTIRCYLVLSPLHNLQVALIVYIRSAGSPFIDVLVLHFPCWRSYLLINFNIRLLQQSYVNSKLILPSYHVVVSKSNITLCQNATTNILYLIFFILWLLF